MDAEQKHIAQKVLMASLDDHDPLRLIEDLAVKIGYNAGYVIRLSERDRQRISECIRFHRGLN
jgi:hypothetical protein